MTIIKVTGGPPECPLCGKKMREVFTGKGMYYFCPEEFCMISIKKTDPCCGRWLETWKERAPKCPLCGNPMRWFYRFDGFMKCQCRNKAHQLVQVARGHANELPPLMGGTP